MGDLKLGSAVGFVLIIFLVGESKAVGIDINGVASLTFNGGAPSAAIQVSPKEVKSKSTAADAVATPINAAVAANASVTAPVDDAGVTTPLDAAVDVNSGVAAPINDGVTTPVDADVAVNAAVAVNAGEATPINTAVAAAGLAAPINAKVGEKHVHSATEKETTVKEWSHFEQCENFETYIHKSAYRPVCIYNKTCMRAFIQGPCKKYEWLVCDYESKQTNRKGVCKPRICPGSAESDGDAKFPRMWISLPNGTCFWINDNDFNFCPSVTAKVYFTMVDRKPYCSEIPPKLARVENIKPIGGGPKGRGLATWFGRVLGKVPPAPPKSKTKGECLEIGKHKYKLCD